jgi:hypothetical protein
MRITLKPKPEQVMEDQLKIGRYRSAGKVREDGLGEQAFSCY